MIRPEARLVAVRRQSKRDRPRRPATAGVLSAMRAEFHAEAGVALEDLGLEEVELLPAPRTDKELGRFKELPSLNALIIDPREGTSPEDVQRHLGDDYLVVPDAELDLPETGAEDGAAAPATADVLTPLAELFAEDTGITGAHADGNRARGAIVAVLDTGVDADHEQFAGQVIDFGYAPLGGGEVRDNRRGFDTATHGTHVCGTLRGRDLGIAPEADLLVVSVMESERQATTLSRIVEAISWVQQRVGRPEYADRPVILSMSLGFTLRAVADEKLDDEMEAMRVLLRECIEDDGMLPVVAIGNEGEGTMRAPGYYPESLSVGAISYDRQSWRKSGGGDAPAPFTGKVCPDIAGFGVGVVSATGRDQHGQSFYGAKNGTSMATPYVAGIAALVAARTGLEGEALRKQLLDDAIGLPGLGPDRVGRGLARYA